MHISKQYTEYTKYIHHKFPSPFFWSRKQKHVRKNGDGTLGPSDPTTATANIEKTLEKGGTLYYLGSFNHLPEKYAEVKLGSSIFPIFWGCENKRYLKPPPR